MVKQIPVVMYHGSQEERLVLSKQLNKQHMVQCASFPVKSFPVVVTSYEVAMRDKDALQRKKWEMVVIDEGHRIKNHQSRLGRWVVGVFQIPKIVLTYA
jgi:ATP-dependent DNA helicase